MGTSLSAKNCQETKRPKKSVGFYLFCPAPVFHPHASFLHIAGIPLQPRAFFIRKCSFSATGHPSSCYNESKLRSHRVQGGCTACQYQFYLPVVKIFRLFIRALFRYDRHRISDTALRADIMMDTRNKTGSLFFRKEYGEPEHPEQ